MRSTSRVLLCLMLVCSFVGALELSLRAAHSAPPTKAEMERKQRELQKKVEEHRREVERQLKSPRSSSSSQATQPTSKQSSTTARNAQPTKGAASQFERCPQAYRLQRGQEFAFDIHVTSSTQNDARWAGRPYLKVMYSTDTHSHQPALVMVFGKLKCERFLFGEWAEASEEDITLPETLWVSEHGSLRRTTASILTQHKLPRQMSAIFPYEELLIPNLPMFVDSKVDNFEGSETRYISGGLSVMQELKGMGSRVLKVTTSGGRNTAYLQAGFLCPEKNIGQKVTQVSEFDPRDSMLSSSQIDYTLRWHGESSLRFNIKRLPAQEVPATRDAASANVNLAKLPKYLWRVPVDSRDVGLQFIRTTSEVRPQELVNVSMPFSIDGSSLSYPFLGRVVQVLNDQRALVRLEGSQEEIDVNHTAIKKRTR